MTDGRLVGVRASLGMSAWLQVAVLLGWAALGPWGCERAEKTPSAEQPDAWPSPSATIGGAGMNVLFVSVDTTRADCLGCYGHPVVKTPHIDRFASEGTRFAWCISSAPLTLVSHCTMLTGCYQFVHGARDNGIFQLDPSNVTLAELLHKAGYATHAEVATIILNPEYGMNQGFETYGGVNPAPPPETDSLDFEEEGDQPDPTEPPLEPEVPDLHLERQAEEITERSIELLRQKAAVAQPFFIFLHYYDPHQPFKAPERFAGQYTDPYFSELAYFDEQFGKLIDALRELGLAEKTLVILTSDHGEGRGQHGEYTHSCFLYDTTQHVPLILWSPGNVPAGRVIDAQVSHIDLAPTVLEFTRLEPVPQMQGESLLPLLAAPSSSKDRPCYADTLTPKHTYAFSPLRMLRDGGWKYILAPKPELYHVAEDPLELLNLIEVEPQRAAEMRQQLRDLIADSPPPPGSRSSARTMDEQELKKLEALGYLGAAAEELQQEPEGVESELDHFEPRGENPHDHVEVIETLSITMGAFRDGRYEEAVELARRLLERSPDNATGLSYLGASLMRLKRYDEAVEVLRHAVTLYPTRWRDHRMLGTILAQMGRLDEAEVSLRKALELNVSDPIAKINLGQLMIMQDRFEDALEELRAAVVQRPESLDAQFHHAICLALLGRPAEAAQGFRDALRLKPSFVPAHRRLARALRESGREDEAIDHLSNAIERMPEEPGLYLALAECYVGKNDLERAGEILMKAAELKPQDAAVQSHLGANLASRGRTDEALERLAQAIVLDPKLVMARLRIAAILHGEGRTDEAVQGLTEAAALMPEEPQLAQALGQCYAETGRGEEALVHFSRAVELAPTSPQARRDLGVTLQGLGRLHEALEEFRKAVELRPTYVEGLALLAYAAEGTGQTEDASHAYRRLIDLAPRYVPAYSKLATIMDGQGEYGAALDWLRCGVEANPDNADLANDLAWRLATSAQAALRDGRKAVELAERANRITGTHNVNVLDTLAAAYAEVGRFEEAIKAAARAVDLATQANEAALASRIASRRELYEAHQPYRDD